jgi:hypothetical protein
MASPLLCSSPLENFNVPDVPAVPDAPSVPDIFPVPDVPAVLDVHAPSVLDGPHCPAVPQVATPQDPTARKSPLVYARIPDPALVSPHPLDVPSTRPRRMPLAITRARVHESRGAISNIWSGHGLRPNANLLFTTSSSQLLSESAVLLRPEGIAQLLERYPDKQFVNTLVTIATSGARIGYEGNPYCRIRKRNHLSTLAHAHVITASIESEIRKGRIQQITSLPDRYYCSPIGLVPKTSDGTQCGWRMIFDLSAPDGQSVNDGIPKEYGAIVYESVEDAMRLVAKMGRGAKLMKRDLKSAFRHIPVNRLDHWLLIFEWEGKFYVDMFLPFGLRTAPRIFNLFSEALHWIFETLYHWNLTHYLDDFLVVFPPGTDISPHSQVFDNVLATVGLTKAPEKDSNGTTVTHLGFEFDSVNMEVRLPPNKKLRALRAVHQLLNASSVSFSALEEALGFLSHCCQVVPLGRPFLRRMFSLLHRPTRRFPRGRTRITPMARKDLKWWLSFLASWSSVSMIKLSRIDHDVATDASGVKGIGGVYRKRLFSERVPARHRQKHINWKEMFAILHAFVLWHKEWAGGRIRLACDNTVVVNAINKRSVKGETIRPLQTILLIAAVFDIEITAFWIPSEENIVADAASRHDFKKLADLGFQVQDLRQRQRTPATKVSTLRQKLFTFLTTRSPLQQERTTTQSKRSRTGSQMSCSKQNQRRQRDILKRSDPRISNEVSIHQSSTIPASNSFSEVANAYMARATKGYGSPLRLQSSDKSLTRSNKPTSIASTSKLPSVWHLPPSFDRESLHGTLGTHHPPSTTYRDGMLPSTTTTPSPSFFPLPKPTLSVKASQFNSRPRPHRQFVPSMHSDTCSTVFPEIPPTPCSPELSAPLTDNISSTKSKNCSSEPASPQLGSQVTRSGKVLPSLPQQTVSLKTTSNSLVDGKAMLSTFISTKSTNTNTPANYFFSILNSTTSTTSRLLNSSLPWLRRINDYALGNPSGFIATSSTGT